jgi:hypothetical protein
MKKFSHEEVMELKRKLARNVGVWTLLVRKADVQAYAAAPGVRRASVGSLHDAAPPPEQTTNRWGADKLIDHSVTRRESSRASA